MKGNQQCRPSNPQMNICFLTRIMYHNKYFDGTFFAHNRQATQQKKRFAPNGRLARMEMRQSALSFFPNLSLLFFLFSIKM